MSLRKEEGMAGSRIKGITVEIGGDTTKLQNALRGVNSEIKSTESQLKDVNKLLKLDPGNTELLAQKQKLLSDAVGETKEKLNTLKTAAEQANTALANGDISKDQYDALQREIIETEDDLKKLEDQANQSSVALQKIADSGEKIKSAGSKVENAGKALLPVTGAVMGLGAAAVKTTADFDSGMSQVAAVSGATGKDFDKLREKAREMGAKTKFSAAEASEAMNYMAMAGWKTGDMVDGIEGIMYLAAASGESLATTSDIVTDALTAMGYSAADSGKLADVMAAASSNANTNVSLMGETFKYAAAVGGSYGYTMEDIALATGLMANAGLKGSQAGTSLRSIMSRLATDAGASSKSIGALGVLTEKLGVQFYNSDGSMRAFRDVLIDSRKAWAGLTAEEQANYAKKIAGQEAMTGWLSIMNATSADFDKLANAVDNCDGTAENMANTMNDNLSGQLTILKSQLEELSIAFGDLIMPALRILVSGIQELVDVLNKLPTPVKAIIGVVALLAAALGPVLIVVGKIMQSVGSIMTMAPKIAGSVKGITSAFSGISAGASGIGAVFSAFAGIASIIGGAILAVKNFIDMFQNGFSAVKDVLMGIGIALAAVGAVMLGAPALIAGVVAAIVFAVANAVILIKEHWTEILTFFSGLWDTIKTLANTAWQSISDTISGIVGGIADFLSGVWTTIGTTASTIWTTISTTIGGIVQGIVDRITSIWQGFLDIFGPLIEAFKYLFETIFQAIQILIERAMDVISQKIQSIWNGIVEFLTPLLTALQTLFETIWTAIQTAIETVLTAIKGVVETIWNEISSVVSTVLNAILSVVTNIWTTIKEYVSSAMNAIKENVSNVWNSVKDGVSSIIGQIYDTIHGGFEKAVDYVKGLASQAFNWGKDLVMGIVDGIKSCVDKVSEAVTGVADNIRSVLHFSVPDEGPLTDYESWMPDFMSGLAKGIEKSRGLISQAISGVAADMVINPTIASGSSAMVGAVGGAGGVSVPLLQSISDRLDAMGRQDGGDIMIPVYIGQDRIDEIVVSATQRANYRSGGR